MTRRSLLAALAATAFVPAARAEAPLPELVVEEGALVDASIEGAPARLRFVTGFINALTLDADFAAEQELKPNRIRGKSILRVGGVKVLRGRNKTVDYAVAGASAKGSALWFEDVPQAEGDGAFGPFAAPQAQIRVRLARARPQTRGHAFGLTGSYWTPAGFQHDLGVVKIGVSLGVEERARLPVASAAAGAELARLYGGALSGEPWIEEIGFGVARPVRLLKLDRPFVLGPFSFAELAVRVRDRQDRMGLGGDIPDADVDPAEILVEETVKGARRPAYTLSIGRAQMEGCASLLFDKAAKKLVIEC